LRVSNYSTQSHNRQPVRTARPQSDEAAPYYFTYINQVVGEDILRTLETQTADSLSLLSGLSEETSLHRYAPEKWSIRQLLNHVTDAERLFAFRALWFARGLDAPLPSFEQSVAAAHADADAIAWSEHVEEFRRVRLSTISLFRNMSPEAWHRKGIASDSCVTVRALAYIIAGHLTHHLTILKHRYLAPVVEA
jgi:uncharacterized damage-inducible protein DinB